LLQCTHIASQQEEHSIEELTLTHGVGLQAHEQVYGEVHEGVRFHVQEVEDPFQELVLRMAELTQEVLILRQNLF
jgi:hypothetical protein